MAVNRFTANFKLRDDLIDSITPQAMINSEISASVGSYKPAAWLPIQFTKSDRDQGTDAYVISAFKPVSLDRDARIVPAGMKTALGGNSATSVFAGTVLTYTTQDRDYGVIDLVTGVPVTGAVSYTGGAVAKALIERGLVREGDTTATIPAVADADVNKIIDAFISDPVGLVITDVLVWSGLPEDGDQVFTNYSKQAGVAFWTHATLQIPHRVAGAVTAEGFDAFTLNAGGSTTAVAGDFIDAGEYWDITNIRVMNRYSALSSTAPVVAIGLAHAPVAKNTDRTPVASDRSGVLVREKSSVAGIAKEGDWYLDADVGVLFLHTDTWATLVALGSATTNVSYSYYTDTGLATGQRYIHFDGPCRPGDWVYYDAQSNLTVASPTIVSAGLAIGRVHKIVTEPRDLLQHVKTGWNLAGAGKAFKVPGSATKGFSDLITLTDEVVADQLVHVKFEV